MYFPFFILCQRSKRSSIRPQTIYSEVPLFFSFYHILRISTTVIIGKGRFAAWSALQKLIQFSQQMNQISLRANEA